MDRTKYDLKITRNNEVINHQSLDKVETAFKIINSLIELELETKDEINSHNFISYPVLLNDAELSEKTPNMQERYRRTLDKDGLVFSRMWNKNSLEKLINYVDEKYSKIFSAYESVETSNEQINTSTMKIPLNQIFYGPPGTGKTYNISSEAEEIVNKTWSKPITKSDKFWAICRHLSNINKYQDKSNSLYKTEKAILWILGYIIRYDEFNNTNSINRKDAIGKGFDKSSSGWSQQAPFLTDFGFADYTKSTVALELNESGIKLKNEAISYLDEKKIEASDLIQWEKGKQDTVAPVFIQDSYYGKILNTTEVGFSPTLSTIYSTLNFLFNEDFFPSTQAEWTEATDELRNKTNIYFNPTKPDGDIKWVCQIARVLFGLGLLKKENNNYSLNKKGNKLIDDIINRWTEITSELSSEKIDYEHAVSQGFVEFITFHQSFSYEEFIEGIRPSLDDGNLTYSLEPGVFKRISDKARWNENSNYVIIIDEINRGNISKIFGELITLIESSKRLFSENPKEHPKQVTLPYSKKSFGVPKNLYILGTMNTADKSIALLDSALRRRFSFIEMLPQSNILTKENVKVEGVEIEKIMDMINQRIEFLIDKDHTIGHSYFLKIKDNPTIEGLALVFKNEIIPLLTEYFYGDFEKIRLVLGDNRDWKSSDTVTFFTKKSTQQKTLFGRDDVVEGYDEKVIFELNPKLFSLKDDGMVIGEPTDLIKLFKSVYVKSNL